MNRAVHGDVVAVEILPENEWKLPGDEVLDQEGMYLANLPRLKLICDRSDS